MALPDSPNTTYAPADPVLSVDLNDLQDCVVAGAHGAQELIVNARGLSLSAGVAMAGGGWAEWSSSGSAYWAPDVHTGDRFTSLTLRVYGNAAADFTVGVYVVTPAAVLTQICPGGVTAAITNPAAAWADATIDLIDTTLAAGESVVIEIAGSASGLRVLSAALAASHPLP